MSVTKMYFVHCLTPTHMGIGRGLGYIDLPIDRDKVTQWPIIRGSALKGVLADFHHAAPGQRANDSLSRIAFGIPGDAQNSANSGSLIFTDAQLVCLPVRSLFGTFAWVTSPLCLDKLRRTLGTVLPQHELNTLTIPPAKDKGVVSQHNVTLVQGDNIYLEDLDLQVEQRAQATAWADKLAQWVFPGHSDWINSFIQRFAIVPDDVFTFLCQTGTEVHTRVRIDDDTKTVAQGALWTEESLPAESILMGLVHCQRVYANGSNQAGINCEQLIDKFASGTVLLQIGGKATVGRGQARIIFSESVASTSGAH
ncbi:MAG: type III-B CRISPR module RAMP protein Cmr4 [Planctomycetaceae bacterium]|nr:MAG: type III-B CRISPR module RAMP protein Cmr4 [Planctomycetaceae bacterium]